MAGDPRLGTVDQRIQRSQECVGSGRIVLYRAFSASVHVRLVGLMQSRRVAVNVTLCNAAAMVWLSDRADVTPFVYMDSLM